MENDFWQRVYFVFHSCHEAEKLQSLLPPLVNKVWPFCTNHEISSKWKTYSIFGKINEKSVGVSGLRTCFAITSESNVHVYYGFLALYRSAYEVNLTDEPNFHLASAVFRVLLLSLSLL